MGNVLEGMSDFFTSLGDFLNEIIKDLKEGSILIGQVMIFIGKLITLFDAFIDMLLDILQSKEFYIDLAEILIIMTAFSLIITQFISVLNTV